jgi:hypothetical protein
MLVALRSNGAASHTIRRRGNFISPPGDALFLLTPSSNASRKSALIVLRR